MATGHRRDHRRPGISALLSLVIEAEVANSYKATRVLSEEAGLKKVVTKKEKKTQTIIKPNTLYF